jgi:hypothetical protein
MTLGLPKATVAHNILGPLNSATWVVGAHVLFDCEAKNRAQKLNCALLSAECQLPHELFDLLSRNRHNLDGFLPKDFPIGITKYIILSAN